MHDPEIERSAAIKSWLAAITSKPIRDLKTLVTDARNALFLSRKYDCPALISSTLYQLHNALDDLTDKSPAIPNEEDIILLGGIFEDHQLIAKAIRIIGNDEFDDEHSETPFPSLHELEDQHISNPSAWSLQEYRRMPVDCIWALCRAYSVSVGLNERAEKFLSLMKDIKGECYGIYWCIGVRFRADQITEFDNPTPKTRKKQKLAYVS